MPRHQAEVDGDTIAELERALQQLRNVGAPDDTAVRIRCRAAFHQDGGTARTVTARWGNQ